MQKITLLFLLFTSTITAQTWNFSIGAATTKYVFTNAQGINPSYLKPASGLQMNLGFEKSFIHRFQYDIGLAYSQYNAVGDVQNIPFSYQTDFIGLNSGIGPKLEFRKNFTLILKVRAAIQKLVNGNQFLQNHYVDLSQDSQFSSLRTFVGFSLELEKKVNSNVFVFTQYQYLDTNTFGNSSLNFVPSSVSFGLKILTK